MYRLYIAAYTCLITSCLYICLLFAYTMFQICTNYMIYIVAYTCLSLAHIMFIHMSIVCIHMSISYLYAIHYVLDMLHTLCFEYVYFIYCCIHNCLFNWHTSCLYMYMPYFHTLCFRYVQFIYCCIKCLHFWHTSCLYICLLFAYIMFQMCTTHILLHKMSTFGIHHVLNICIHL